jgi:hypothetical protein
MDGRVGRWKMNRIIADAGRQQNGLKFSTNITKEVFAAQAGKSSSFIPDKP